MKSLLKSLPAILVSIVVVSSVVYATTIKLTAPTGTPSATYYTLDDIYSRLTANTTAGSHTVSTTTAPADSFHTLTELYNAIPTIYPGDLLASSTYLGITGSVTVKTGNTVSASSSAQSTSLVLTVPVGYYSGVSSVTVSTSSDNFLATNIADGVNLFGVTGSLAGGSTAAAPLKTGQTKCYATDGISTAEVACTGTNQDGESKRGVATSTIDNADGTISDSATGLMWVKDPSEIPGGTWGTSGTPATMLFADAITNCEALDYASHTDWHLPNIRELQTLVDFGRANPAIDPIKFPNTQSDYYWSVTTYGYPGGQNYAWYVFFDDGNTNGYGKDGSYYVRCVRE